MLIDLYLLSVICTIAFNTLKFINISLQGGKNKNFHRILKNIAAPWSCKKEPNDSSKSRGFYTLNLCSLLAKTKE